jgi:hypothetical protein
MYLFNHLFSFLKLCNIFDKLRVSDHWELHDAFKNFKLKSRFKEFSCVSNFEVLVGIKCMFSYSNFGIGGVISDPRLHIIEELMPVHAALVSSLHPIVASTYLEDVNFRLDCPSTED